MLLQRSAIALASELAAENGWEEGTVRSVRPLQHCDERTLPPQPLTTIGAKIHLAWREWRAGTE
ncbi:hypothetical protein CO652_17690 [Rhizobium sp. H4]|uniref:Uncharacterized protein n=1 Tax=Rhizobium croatiense TaxID=2867516 RepID=A0ABS7LTH3_9HYPH|nr:MULTISPECIES: hypothetical protein [Rhizobium]MBY4628140.1 hypothetical protein [Rhizobium croatiense]PDV87126.1 hypothetical protein CO652_17690 [Rhizobium sp. H4]